MAESGTHHPVLLDEVLESLALRPDGNYLDGTFGRGGHAHAILERLGPRGRLYAMDKDPQAVQTAIRRFGADSRFQFRRASFARLEEWMRATGMAGRLSGVLFDLGVSSPQLDEPQRGFSFQSDGPLDMRMDPEAGVSAADWLATADEKEIARVIKGYGEERFARRIARAIVRSRLQAPICTTGQLAALVAATVPGRERHKHPATRTFQAIRIHINSELDELREGLRQAADVLQARGRLVVISFHSLEDRCVKRFMREESRGPVVPPEIPLRGEPVPGRLRIVGKVRRPDAEEIARNPRARSAVLRVAERAA
jgi:16S rRNA (cytosine1402-N4)-methyltransferase